MYGMMWGRAARVKSLNPHCVSRMREVAGGVRRRRRRWKECIRVLRRAERCEGGVLVFVFWGGGVDGWIGEDKERDLGK